jgi:protein ImuA
MPALKADIITQLKKDILSLQGFKPFLANETNISIPIINHSFPNALFPLGVNHEFICTTKETQTASTGFIAGILAALLQKDGAVVWISSSHIIFPPALAAFGIDPAKIIFIHLRNQKQILWTIEEALKCRGLTAVVGELATIDLTVSRRLQLAAEQSRVTGFLLSNNNRQLNTTACVCRWQISSIKSQTEVDIPGLGHPAWQVDLLKVRNGKPASCQLEWKEGNFVPFDTELLTIDYEHKKVI